MSDASVISNVMGANGMPKGPGKLLHCDGVKMQNLISTLAWSARKPNNPNLISLRSLEEHASRRRRWSRAFNSASVKGYETTLQRRASQLATVLEAESNQCISLDLHKWLSFFTYKFTKVILKMFF